jgi:hypothetical protein
MAFHIFSSPNFFAPGVMKTTDKYGARQSLFGWFSFFAVTPDAMSISWNEN